MTSLADAYAGGDDRSGVPRRRLLLGVALFAVGTVLSVAGLVVGTTQAFVPTDPSAITYNRLTWGRHVGGLLAGIGVPAVLLGISTVLPASRRTRAAAVVGTGVALVGVALFWHAYPCQWSGSSCLNGRTELTLHTVGTYFLGVLTVFWCLFAGVANFKTRNDPGGTVTMEVTRQGETRVIEVPREEASGLGGVGFFGSTPDGEVETQTNRGAVSDGGAEDTDVRGLSDGAEGWGSSDPDTGTGSGAGSGVGSAASAASRSSSGRSASTQSSDAPTRSGTSGTSGTSGGSGRSGTADPGASTDPTGDAEIMRDAEPGPSAGAGPTGDSYCGSCAHFEYVETGQGIQPYCGLHDELMDDMDACERWTPRGRGDDGR
jgi:hypothetical protein